METDDIPSQGPAHYWTPMSNPHDLAVLEKLGEEVNELGAVIFRCLSQGLDETNPETGKLNRVWLQEEIADVASFVEITIRRMELDQVVIENRKQLKIAFKEPWFDALAEKSNLERKNKDLSWFYAFWVGGIIFGLLTLLISMLPYLEDLTVMVNRK